MMQPPNSQQLLLPLDACPAYQLDDYLPGKNEAAYAQLQSIASGKAQHPIYLWGAHCTGKTHLLQAVCQAAQQHGISAAYIRLQQSQTCQPQQLQALLHHALVCLDDLDAIAGNAAWEEAILHLYNARRDAAQNILLADRFSPQKSRIKLADLKSRLTWGLCYHLYEADDDSKIQILKNIAATRSLKLDDEVFTYLIQRVKRDTSYLLQFLNYIDQASLEAQRHITIPFVRTLLDSYAPND